MSHRLGQSDRRIARYDPHERVAGPPLPHLFQRQYGTERRVITPAIVTRLLNLALDRTGLRGPDGQPIRYTAHDFRRIFTTEAEMSRIASDASFGGSRERALPAAQRAVPWLPGRGGGAMRGQ